jgi:gamma-glutamyltranspeptidase/glutathione hydrolase
MQPTAFEFDSRRSMVLARRGMVAASNPLAAQAGLDVLKRGGSAADAAIATAAVLNVTAPASTGIGGDCFALYYDAATGQISALNGSGRAPAALTIDLMRARGHSVMPLRDALAVTVPGAVRGWEDLLARHGRMTLGDVLTDAIYYAREGFPVSPVFGAAWNAPATVEVLRSSPYAGDYLPGGSPPQVGQVVRLPGLANSLQAIAEGGAEAFYTGPIADSIVRTLQAFGGVMTHDDLAAHVSTWDIPIATNYRDVTVIECPPNGQGLAALLALNIAEGFHLGDLAWNSPERLHLMIESMRLAFADARHYIADPAVQVVPVGGLLDKVYAAHRRELIRMDRAMSPPGFGAPPPGSNTVYLSVIDGEGNACSFINSLYYGFGSSIVAEGTGIFLQNRGANFSLDAAHPNALAPTKRPYHTIIPGMALRGGQLWASFGVMGGFMQPQGHFQVISALVDDDLNPQAALDRLRFCLRDGTAASTLALEDGLPPATISRLAELGHPVEVVSGFARGVFGSGQIILRDAHGVLYGGSDPRKDGLVAGY